MGAVILVWKPNGPEYFLDPFKKVPFSGEIHLYKSEEMSICTMAPNFNFHKRCLSKFPEEKDSCLGKYFVWEALFGKVRGARKNIFPTSLITKVFSYPRVAGYLKN
jgi:hypothetical protein